MIAELFYPKELKEIIRKLEAEDNLRREPLEELDKLIYLSIFMFCALVLVVFWSSGGVPALISVIVFTLITIRIARCHYAYLRPYALGEEKLVTVIDFKVREFRRGIPNKDIICELDSLSKRLIIPAITNIVIEKWGVSIGDNISVYHCPKSKYIISNKDEFKKQYCIRRDLIKEINHE